MIVLFAEGQGEVGAEELDELHDSHESNELDKLDELEFLEEESAGVIVRVVYGSWSETHPVLVVALFGRSESEAGDCDVGPVSESSYGLIPSLHLPHYQKV